MLLLIKEALQLLQCVPYTIEVSKVDVQNTVNKGDLQEVDRRSVNQGVVHISKSIPVYLT